MRRRLSTGRLMAVIALLAADFAGARAVWQRNPELLLGLAPMAVAVQVVLLLAAWRRRIGPFAIGFLIGGLAMMGTYARAMLTPEILGISFQGGAMVLNRTPGSPAYEAWMAYAGPVSDRVGPLLFDPRIDLDGNPAVPVVRAAIWTAPQLVVALAGGCLGLAIRAGRRGRDGRRQGSASVGLQGEGAPPSSCRIAS